MEWPSVLVNYAVLAGVNKMIVTSQPSAWLGLVRVITDQARQVCRGFLP